MTPTITRWDGCYRDGWQDLIVPEAFAHPAKYSRGLIHRIYRHLLERGYVRPGQTVLDPFGGASLGAIDAATCGLQWIGVELEENFRIISHKNMLLWSQERWCTCGNDGAAYVSALRHSVSADSRGGEQNTPSQERPVLLKGMSQPSLFHWEENQRSDTPEIPRTATVEQGQAVVASHESQALDFGEWGESQGREEWSLARGPLAQFHGVCGDTSGWQAQTGTPACDGAGPGTTIEAQRACPPSQRRQDGQSPREPRTDDLKPAHEASQPQRTAPDVSPDTMPDMRNNRGDTLHGGSDTNRLLLINLQERTSTRLLESVPRPQTCQTCGKFLAPLPVLLQGDSRQLRQVLAGVQAACCVGSPPFGEQQTGGGIALTGTPSQRIYGSRSPVGYVDQGTSPGQLGALPPGTPPSALVSSPPYAGAGQVLGTHNGIDYSKVQGSGKAPTPARIASGEGYGTSAGQLGAMPAGAIISSPPYAEALAEHRPGRGPGQTSANKPVKHGERYTQTGASNLPSYGTSTGQLGAMPAGAVVSSPPWESSDPRTQGTGAMPRAKRSASSLLNNPTCQFGQSISGEAYGTSAGQLGAMPAGAIVGSPPWENQEPSHAQGDSRCFGTGGQTYKDSTYGTSPDQLGNATGDTFWSAADAVMREVSALLPVGGIACWVLKGYVSKGRLVNFPAQWLALCQAHGFTLLEEIHASLIEESGVQETLFGEAERVQVERKSFFRRLHEKRPGAVRIDHETVLILRKEA